MKLNYKYYILLAIIIFVGFMIKLPKPFVRYDKELHLAFYFLLMFFLFFQWSKWSFKKTVLSGLMSSGFGFFIEKSQAFSNRFFTRKIHGRFDWDDILANTTGILLFFVVWLALKMIRYVLTTIKNKNQAKI